MTNPVVIYHGGCADGMAAAWCFWKRFPDWEYYPGYYGKDELPDVKDRAVYLVDFSYPRETLIKILETAKSVILLDHHKSMFEDLKDFKHPNFDMSHSTEVYSGAMIAWYYTKSAIDRVEAPPILRHIQDRDLWKFELPYTREIMAAVFSHPFSFEYFDWLMDLDPYDYEDLKMQGAAILRVEDKAIKSIIKATKRSINPELSPEISWNSWCLINSPPMYASEIGSKLSEEYPIVAIYHDTAYDRKFSLRSKTGTTIDVSIIAKHYGGGGHKHAAGFAVPRDHFLAKI
jgi:oligoribonuclease NrnB/cAMP/cGMP phosphodiesterase (DHH superfamily)